MHGWRYVLLSLLLFLPALVGAQQAPALRPLRVLFLGNSLTYTNNLPGLLVRMARADSLPLETRDASGPNFGLEDHWKHPASWAAVKAGPWDVVVLQQGPSSLPESRVDLVSWSRRWADTLRVLGIRPALYMVWPDRSRLAYLPEVMESYRVAAESAGAALLPAGRAWGEAWRTDPGLPLYGPDGFHPSLMGSYLAGMTLYRGLTGRIPPRLPELGFTTREEALFQRAADVATSPAPAPGAR